jgi:hypothetical protein
VGEKPLKVACFLFFIYIKDLWNALCRLVGGSQDKNKERKKHYNLLLWYVLLISCECITCLKYSLL